MSTKGRYEIREVLGEGGMGIVSRAYDPVMRREVAVKTIRDSQDKAVLELFKRECAVLASMTHPNIVEIFDIGETEEVGAKRPYFVMPLLRGETLQKLIETYSPRLTVERSVQIIGQVCRGLQAAHEQGLVHRDLKPSNIFVMSDDSVKIIDFGVAYLTNQHSATGMKGTLPYMSPEQLRLKQPTPLSDQFSLAVVCYEMLARRRPFIETGDQDLAEAIVNQMPAPVSEFNPIVSPAISQVIHKALAKEPFYRFSNVREFSDCLHKALRGEPIEKLDQARIAPRLQRARKAFNSGDLDDASEILSELEAANFLVPEIRDIRRQINEAQRSKTIKQLLETAHRRFDEGEYVRALQKVQEVFDLDANNADAFTLKGAIETRYSATQIDDWFRLAGQHMENHAYAHARQALEKVLELRPKEPRGQILLAEVERREQEYVRLRTEKQQVYESALDACKRGDLNSALNKLDRLLDLDRRAPNSTSPEQGASYQKLYEEVRSKRDQVSSQEAEARRHLSEGKFAAATTICDQVLAVYPNNVVFRVLRDDVEQVQRQELSAYIAKIEREVATEPDFNRKVSILEEAREKYPSEQRFDQSLQQVQSRRGLVDSIVGKARTFEEARQFSDALGQWETLRNIYPQFPGIDIEIERLKRRREQQARADAKAHWVTQIDQASAVHNYAKAISLITDAITEFPGDVELIAMKKQTEQAQARASEAEEKANQGNELYASGHLREALDLLREAAELTPHNLMVRSGLLEILLKEARGQIDGHWQAAEQLIHEALEIDSSNPEAKSLGTQIQDKRQAEEVSAALASARELQSAGMLKEASDAVDMVLAVYPRENRLIQFRESLWQSLPAENRQELRTRHLNELIELAEESRKTKDVGELESIFAKSRAYSAYESEAAFSEHLSTIDEQIGKKREATKLPLQLPPVTIAGGEGSSPQEQQSADDSTTQRKDVSEKWATGFPGLLKNALWTAASFTVIAFLIWGVLHSQGAKQVPATKVVTLEVRNADPQEYKIKAGDGTDVTAILPRGLPEGSYSLVASRAGFQAVQLPFKIDPATEPHKILVVQWQPVMAELRFTLERPVGGLKVDGVDQPLANSTQFYKQLPAGHHSIRWGTSDSNSVEIPFDINGKVSLKSVVLRGSVVGIVAALNKNEITYEAIYSFGGITKTVGGQPEALPSSGKFLLQSPQIIGFKIRPGGYPLGDFHADPTGPPVIYIFLALPQRPAGDGKRKAKEDEAPPEPPANSLSIGDPPKPTEEEQRQREREEEIRKYREEVLRNKKQ